MFVRMEMNDVQYSNIREYCCPVNWALSPNNEATSAAAMMAVARFTLHVGK